MEGQQSTQLYTEGTQNQDKVINDRHLENLLKLDVENFIKYLTRQFIYSQKVILDTNMFSMLPLEKLVFLIGNENNDTRGHIDKISSKNYNYMGRLISILGYYKGFIVTPEVIHEMEEMILFWKLLANPKKIRRDQRMSNLMGGKRDYYLILMNKNKDLKKYLTEIINKSVKSEIEMRNFLLDDNRVLNVLDNNKDGFKKMLKHYIWDTYGSKKKPISETDKTIFYSAFVNALNCPTGIISRDNDFLLLKEYAKKYLNKINKKLRKDELKIMGGVYSDLPTHVINIRKS